MDFILYLPKRFSVALIGVFFCMALSAQDVTRVFYRDSIPVYLAAEKHTANKLIPTEYEAVIKIALLYFPELEQTAIEFRVKKQVAPLSARPKIWSIFAKSKKRKYIISISNETIEKLNGILLSNLSFNAQIGVIGHELSHIVEYDSKRGIYFVGLALRHLSRKSMDRFEYNTDKRCIEHKLGYQLLSWSEEVRMKLKQEKWGGANKPKRERYMNPETIREWMKKMPIYDGK
ncbi:MAG: hypothetical protein ACRCYO_18840 [Bacteroidia bacterium]